MRPVVPDSCPQLAGNEALQRDAVRSPTSGVTDEVWSAVHDEIQRGLAPLDKEVKKQLTEVLSKGFRTSGSRFPLFSYRTFCMPNSTVDPVVVGVTFWLQDDKLALEADVSGEELGDVMCRCPKIIIPPTRDELLRAAKDLVKQLCHSADQVAAALTNPSRKIE